MIKIYSKFRLFLVLGTFLISDSLNAKIFTLSDVFELGSFSVTMASKSMETEEQVISFGEKITFLEEILPDVSWTIRNTNTHVIVAFGSGDSLSRYVFNIPGNYQIEIQDNTPHNHDDHDDCGHPHYPDLITLTVSPVRMTFEMSSVALSREIVGGQETDGTELTISVFVEIFTGSPVTLSYPTFRSAGVETTIEGMLTNPHTVLHTGINVLTYRLTGTATSGTYIMFDFPDYNGHVQSYYLPNIIP